MDKRIAFIVNNVAFFVSHRLPIAVGAMRAGYQVDLYTGQGGSPKLENPAMQELAKHAIRHSRVAFTASGRNPLLESAGIVQLARQLRRNRPLLVHCASPKGVLYGGVAARIAGVPTLVAAISGQGYANTVGEDSVARRVARIATFALSKVALGHRNVHVIVQNADDKREVIAGDLAPMEKITLIPGSGIELERYVQFPIECKEPIVLLPARMLRDKGICEFADAAGQLKKRFGGWRFLLAGTADYDNPSSIDTDTLRQWQQRGVVEWLGHVDNLDPLYARASIVCLPSYREGLPKVLLEAAAAGCAVVTTDTIGCREAILPGETGDLVAPRDSTALAQTLAALIEDPVRRESYGRAGRRMAIKRFSIDAVVSQTLSLYERLIRDRVNDH